MSVPEFDSRLAELLAERAATAGVSQDQYVRKAVVDRLVQELEADPESSVGNLLRHLRAVRDELAEVQGFGSSGDDGTDVVGSLVTDAARLEALHATGLLDSPQDAGYDRIVAMAAEALSVPAAAVTLVDRDRQFFKSAMGLPEETAAARQIPLSHSICRYAVDTGEPVVVEDGRVDDIFKNHPMITENILVSYLGIPLMDSAGHALGTLCVWDSEPRQWTTGHIQTLQDLAWIVRERIFG